MTKSSSDKNNISADKLNRLIATINSWPEAATRDFLEDYPNQSLDLVMALKYHANPLAGYPLVSWDIDSYVELNNVFSCLKSPEKLQPEIVLTSAERAKVIEMLRVKLDSLAKSIMLQYKIPQSDIQAKIEQYARSQPQFPANNEPAAKELNASQNLVVNQWWDGLTDQQKHKIIEKDRNLVPEQKKYLQHIVYENYQVYPRHQRYYYYQMSLYDAELSYLTLRTVCDIADITLWSMVFSYPGRGYYSGGGFNNGGGYFSSGGSYSSSGVRDADGRAVLAAVAITAFVAMAVAAVASAVYALKKTFNSFVNIGTATKPLKSFMRLAGIAGGAYGGMLAGGAIGAALGSVIPGFGTAAGAVLGMVCGACIGGGLGALIAKYTTKLISYVYTSHFNKDAISMTNPGKWSLSKNQKVTLKNKGISVLQVENVIKDIKVRKDQIGCSGSFFWTDARHEKNALNKQLKDVKEGIGFFQSPSYIRDFANEPEVGSLKIRQRM